MVLVETFKEKVFDLTKNKEWTFQGQKPAIIDFYADWCGPCRALSPILDSVAKKYSNEVDIYKVNTEASPELAALFGIRSIPSVVFISMSGEPAISSGVISEEGFDHAIFELFGIKSTVVSLTNFVEY
jgi:thioredoxin 1